MSEMLSGFESWDISPLWGFAGAWIAYLLIWLYNPKSSHDLPKAGLMGLGLVSLYFMVRNEPTFFPSYLLVVFAMVTAVFCMAHIYMWLDER